MAARSSKTRSPTSSEWGTCPKRRTSTRTSPASNTSTMVGQLCNLPPKPTADCIDGLLRLFSLHSDRHSPISAYSKGMRQKILFSAALLHDPDLILLDEPFSGLDAGSALVLRSLIQELAARGKVVLFSSHELETVERVCSCVVILHRGRIVADDSIRLTFWAATMLFISLIASLIGAELRALDDPFRLF